MATQFTPAAAKRIAAAVRTVENMPTGTRPQRRRHVTQSQSTSAFGGLQGGFAATSSGGLTRLVFLAVHIEFHNMEFAADAVGPFQYNRLRIQTPGVYFVSMHAGASGPPGAEVGAYTRFVRGGAAHSHTQAAAKVRIPKAKVTTVPASGGTPATVRDVDFNPQKWPIAFGHPVEFEEGDLVELHTDGPTGSRIDDADFCLFRIGR